MYSINELKMLLESRVNGECFWRTVNDQSSVLIIMTTGETYRFGLESWDTLGIRMVLDDLEKALLKDRVQNNNFVDAEGKLVCGKFIN